MKKFARALCSLLLVVCLCGGIPAYAQDAAPAAIPADHSPRTVVRVVGKEALRRNVKAFLTNYGSPYRFAPAQTRTAADPAGAAPAADSVAVLRIYVTYPYKDAVINTDGHSFISVVNTSAAPLEIGGLMVAPGTGITAGTRGNHPEHSGLWYNVEGYNLYHDPGFYVNLTCMQLSLDQAQLDAVNAALAAADKWSAFSNCAAFTTAVWNAVCTDTLCAGVPCTPADLGASMANYPDKLTADPEVPYDYIVYYGYPAIPSRDFA